MNKSKLSFILLLLCASLIPLTVYQPFTVAARGNGGGGWESGGGEYTPRGGVGLPTGDFKLNRRLTDQNGLTCAYYNDFELNANANQQFKARLWTSGATINYTIVPNKEFTSLKQAGCSYLSGLSSQVQSFNSPISLDWTAPQTGQYNILFYSTTPYNGPIYCLPQSQ